MPLPIAAVYAGVAVAGGISSYMSGRKKKKWARRHAETAAAKAAEQQKHMDRITGQIDTMANQDLQRYENFYAPSEQRVSEQLEKGQDVEGRAGLAGDDFTNQFDASTDAGRRAMQRQGVRPGSSAMARFEEDISFNRARGASSAMNEARTRADDTNFARNLAFSQTGQSIRQGITNTRLGQFGMHGQIKGQYSQEESQQRARAAEASGQMGSAITGAVTGAMGYGMDPNGMQFMTSSEREKFKVDQPALASESALDTHFGR